MNEGLILVGGVGLGAGLMYFFDPESGRRRRALVSDQLVGALRRINGGEQNAPGDDGRPSQGLEAEIRSWLDAEHDSGNRQGGLNPFEENWTQTTRLVAGALGCGLMANCLAQRTLPAALLGTLGFGLFMRNFTNRSLGQLFGTVGRRQGLTDARREDESSGHDITGNEMGPGF
jgi:hypothetical protein